MKQKNSNHSSAAIDDAIAVQKVIRHVPTIVEQFGVLERPVPLIGRSVESNGRNRGAGLQQPLHTCTYMIQCLTNLTD